MAKNPPKNNAPTLVRRSEVDAFLRKVASTPVATLGKRGRLLFALDATASREPTWDSACKIQGEMFSETASLGGLDVQMAYYRGFGEFRTTGWLTNSRDLVAEMTAVSCLGGETQIRKILSHTIEETSKNRINAVVFVGDCCEEDADQLSLLAGRLGLLAVPLFLFQEGHDPVAARVFSHLAKLTNGAHCRFDAGSPQQLRDLLAAVAVYAAGGRKALTAYGRRHNISLLTNQVR